MGFGGCKVQGFQGLGSIEIKVYTSLRLGVFMVYGVGFLVCGA